MVEKANVVPFHPTEVGDGYRFDPDQILDEAKGRKFVRLVIIGEIEGEDDLYVAGNANAGESIILMEHAKLDIIAR